MGNVDITLLFLMDVSGQLDALPCGEGARSTD
jgi:hypothetical protein